MASREQFIDFCNAVRMSESGRRDLEKVFGDACLDGDIFELHGYASEIAYAYIFSDVKLLDEETDSFHEEFWDMFCHLESTDAGDYARFYDKWRNLPIKAFSLK